MAPRSVSVAILSFVVWPQAGITAWSAAAAHEVPQELGDFGVLVHGGWPPRRALSALTFPLGAVPSCRKPMEFPRR